MMPVPPLTPIGKLFSRCLPPVLVPIAIILTYAFLIFAIGLTIGAAPSNILYIDVRGDK